MTQKTPPKDDQPIEVRMSLSSALLLLFALAAFCVAFASAAIRGLDTGNATGFSRLAHQAAIFPYTAREAVTQAFDTVTGVEADKHLTVEWAGFDLTGFAPLENATGDDIPGLLYQASDQAPRGWRVLSGTMMVNDAPGSVAVLIDPDFVIRQVWHLNEDRIPNAQVADTRRMVHGIEVTRTGGLIYAFDNGISMQAQGPCEEPLWGATGTYHHTATLSDDGALVWGITTVSGANSDPRMPRGGTESFVALNAETGEMVKSVTMVDVVAANPDVAIIDLPRRVHDVALTNPLNDQIDGDWLHDPWHFNDVDPLPAALAPAFPMFEAGDLLISARTINAVFVIDPDTLEIKWHRLGATRAQHDPDWHPNGTITVYDNRMGWGDSDIIAFDPATFERSVVLAGKDHNFYSFVRGKHVWIDEGHLQVTATQQARVFEVTPDGTQTTEFFSLRPGNDGLAYPITEAIWLPEDALSAQMYDCGANN